MGSISDYLENELLDHIFGVGAWTAPSTVYIGLSTADPLDDASGIAEPSGNNYARETIAFNAAATRKVENTSLVTFNQASGSWGTITHWFICDHLTNTTFGTNVNLLAQGLLAVSKAVVNGNTPSIAAQQVDVEFSAGEISNYLSHALLNFAFRNTSYSQPTIYIALCDANASDSDTGSSISEPSGNNYARDAHASWNTASGGATDNNGAITFQTPSGSWGTITAIAILDALSAGNLLFYENTVTDQEPTTDDTVEFASGDLDVSLS